MSSRAPRLPGLSEVARRSLAALSGALRLAGIAAKVAVQIPEGHA